MGALLIGYARVSTDGQDLTAQRDGLTALGVAPDRTYIDHGLTGTNRERPGLAKRWPRAERATPWWSPSSTASPGPCPTPRDRRRADRSPGPAQARRVGLRPD